MRPDRAGAARIVTSSPSGKRAIHQGQLDAQPDRDHAERQQRHHADEDKQRRLGAAQHREAHRHARQRPEEDERRHGDQEDAAAVPTTTLPGSSDRIRLRRVARAGARAIIGRYRAGRERWGPLGAQPRSRHSAPTEEERERPARPARRPARHRTPAGYGWVRQSVRERDYPRRGRSPS